MSLSPTVNRTRAEWAFARVVRCCFDLKFEPSTATAAFLLAAQSLLSVNATGLDSNWSEIKKLVDEAVEKCRFENERLAVAGGCACGHIEPSH